MKWLIIILVILALIALGALIWWMGRRKQEEARRDRADELRSEAASVGAERPMDEAKAREAQAEAQRARAEADQLEAQAAERQRSYDMTRAQEEDRLREADRLDPDVDHTGDDYEPGVAQQGADEPAEADVADPRYRRPEGEHRA